MWNTAGVSAAAIERYISVTDISVKDDAKWPLPRERPLPRSGHSRRWRQLLNSSISHYNSPITQSSNSPLRAWPWLAHFYTGLGAAVALAAALAVISGEYREAFIWLGLQILIDATDGLLARWLRVKERLPDFDGARLDDLIDYLCYAFIPVLLLLHARLLPPFWGEVVGSIVLMASGYGFSQTAAKVKTTDYFFTGFPSYWNLVAFYMFLLQLPPWVNAAILVAFAVLVFVPLRYVYPSRTQTLAALTNSLALIWGALLVWLVWRLPVRDDRWVWLSLAFPVYYFGLSLWLDRRSRRLGPAPSL